MSYIPAPLLHLIAYALEQSANYTMSPALLALLAQESDLLAALQRLSLSWLGAHAEPAESMTRIVEAEAWTVK